MATKLHVPDLRPGLVAREELVARLVEGADRKLTLVCAPAGWGKTLLLSSWHDSKEESRPFAWVSLDPGDDDQVRFWSYLIAALRTVEPELGRSAQTALPSAGPDLVEVVVSPLINDLANAKRRIVLTLDDYHFVRNELIHTSVAYLLRHLPSTTQIAISSRADPPLPLAALRAAGEVTEIRAADLRFTDQEADALLNSALGLGLDAADVELLQVKTEGWPAGLQLAALSVQGQDDRHAFVAAFAGDDRQIGDYLHDVLAEQPMELRGFLLRTSILERLCAPLCDVVTGSDRARAHLEAIYRSNLFLVALDGRGEWYRYHHLFRDLLRQELARSDPSLVAVLHRRASAWHRERGDTGEAVAHATAAGDFADTCELIARHWRPLWNLGQRETLVAWIDALPRDAVLADPRVCLARGWTSLFLGRADEVEGWIRAAERGTPPGPFYDGSVSAEENAALLRCTHAYFSGDVGRSVDEGRRALSLHPEAASPVRAVSGLVLALPLYLAGELTSARELLEDVHRRLPERGWAETLVAALGALAAVRLDDGELAPAEQAVADAERVMAELGLDESPSGTLVCLARGRLLGRRGDGAGAGSAFVRASVLARRAGRRLDHANALITHARLERRRDHAKARSLAQEARAVLASCPDPGVLADALASTERALQLAPPHRTDPQLPADPELSERELTVLRLLDSTLTQREIAAELYVSFNTVKWHARSIFRKLGVASRDEAVARGHELDLL